MFPVFLRTLLSAYVVGTMCPPNHAAAAEVWMCDDKVQLTFDA